jgi:hypothetical protein
VAVRPSLQREGGNECGEGGVDEGEQNKFITYACKGKVFLCFF